MKFNSPNFKRSSFALVALFNVLLEITPIFGGSDVDKHLETGTKLLAAGQLSDALQHYNLAVDGDPKNYLTYFRRATVYMALGKSKSAIPDLDMAIELNPEFRLALLQRGNLFLKSGRFSQARNDYKAYLLHDPNHSEANSQLSVVNEISDHAENAKSLYENEMFQEAISYLDKVIEVSPMSEEIREMRAKSYLKLGDRHKAIQDFRHSVKMTNDNTEGLLKLSVLMYEAGEPEQSLIEIRECLRLDQDHKACFKHYKSIKKLVKLLEKVQQLSNEKQYEECVEKAQKVLKTEGHIFSYELTANQHICHCKTKLGSTEAIDLCTKVLNINPNNEEVLLDRAEAYINAQMYDEAIIDYQKILGTDRRHQRASDGLKRAQKLLKNSKNRDYYKILGVPRTARKKDILKAYRKLAAEYHPDHYKGDDKKKAEKTFIDITDAKEVLTDPEKKAKFDNGEDPLDPEQQQHPFSGGGGGFPFHNFNPFGDGGGGGGDGYHYEFHFG